jgi:hypothetical protein
MFDNWQHWVGIFIVDIVVVVWYGVCVRVCVRVCARVCARVRVCVCVAGIELSASCMRGKHTTTEHHPTQDPGCTFQ